MLLTNRRTKAGKNITSLTEVIKRLIRKRQEKMLVWKGWRKTELQQCPLERWVQRIDGLPYRTAGRLEKTNQKQTLILWACFAVFAISMKSSGEQNIAKSNVRRPGWQVKIGGGWNYTKIKRAIQVRTTESFLSLSADVSGAVGSLHERTVEYKQQRKLEHFVYRC